MNDKTGFLWQVFTAVNGWITFADTKAAALLAANGVIAGLVFAHLDETLRRFHDAPGAAFVACLGIVALLCSIIFAVECVLPRLTLKPGKLWGYVFKSQPLHEPTSSLFFDHIAQMKLPEYEAKVNALLAEPEAIQQITQQIWMNSRVASRKHRDVALSAWSFALAMTFGFISVVMLAVQGAI